MPATNRPAMTMTGPKALVGMATKAPPDDVAVFTLDVREVSSRVVVVAVVLGVVVAVVRVVGREVVVSVPVLVLVAEGLRLVSVLLPVVVKVAMPVLVSVLVPVTVLVGLTVLVTVSVETPVWVAVTVQFGSPSTQIVAGTSVVWATPGGIIVVAVVVPVNVANTSSVTTTVEGPAGRVSVTVSVAVGAEGMQFSSPGRHVSWAVTRAPRERTKTLVIFMAIIDYLLGCSC